MGTFDASLRTMGDRTGLPATLTVLDGRLTIAAGDQEIGQWSLDEIRLEPTPTGYRMAAEGEQILLDIEKVDDFAQALNGKKQKARREREGESTKPPKASNAKGKRVRPSEGEPSQPVAAAITTPEPSASPATPETNTPSTGGFLDKITGFIDSTLEQASQKWGGLLPAWMFTRGIVYVLLALFAVVLIFPSVVFWILLIAGILMVMFGAVVYTDSVAAARWLPGRMTAMHILIYGVGLVVAAVFVGVASANRLAILMLGVLIAAGVTFAARFRGSNAPKSSAKSKAS